jgi:hypothetical protein
MSASRALLLLPLRRMPLVAGVLIFLLGSGAGGLLLAGWRRSSDAAALALALLMAANLLWHLLAGNQLREFGRREHWLLPQLKRQLLRLGVYGLLGWSLLAGAVVALIGGAPQGCLIAAASLLLSAFGLCIGSGRALALWLGLAVMAADVLAPGLLRHPMFWQSPLAIVVLLALALALLWLALHPLGRVEDADPAQAPLSAVQPAPSLEGRRRTPIWRALINVFDALAERAMQQQLRRYRQRPNPARRLRLVRSLLLPHDNLTATVLRLLGMGVLVIGFVAFRQKHTPQDASFVVWYAILLALTRFPQVGRGMQRMQPHLADLYLTLAPATHAHYQQTLAQVLRVLVPGAVLNALGFTVLGLLVLHEGVPFVLLLLTLIIATAYALVALALHLIGPQGPVARGLVNGAVVLAATLSFYLGRWLIELFGLWPGSLLLALPALSFGIGVWLAAQQEYARRRPLFEAPAE